MNTSGPLWWGTGPMRQSSARAGDAATAAAAPSMARRLMRPADVSRFMAPLDLRLFRIHQHEQDAARLLAAVDPGMVGRLLHHGVARLEMNAGLVEHHVDLARNHDGIIERAAAVHHRVLHRRAARR